MNGFALWKPGMGFALLALATCALADFDYKVQATENSKTVTVELRANTVGGKVSFQVPKWSPGHYRYEDYASKLSAVQAKDSEGKSIGLEHPDSQTWTASTGSKSVTLTYNADVESSENIVHYAGPATYMYVVGRTQEPCHLQIQVPSGWKVAIGLKPRKDDASKFDAPSYDVLADNPVTLGLYTEAKYMSHGKEHIIALRGSARNKIDLSELLKNCQFITEMETDFMGDMPYDRYVWHGTVFEAPDGGWGLEHLSSTSLGISSGLGPGMVGVLAHEFFHLWNVKRVRSAPLGPFDYQTMPQTGALWWLEGVTDYYAHVLLHRYGLTDDERFSDVIVGQVRGVRGNPARLQVSPYESSFRVRDADNGKGNSDGFGVSYYNSGWLAGLCLDAEIRSQSGGKHSLDDVMHALYSECKNSQPGFAEDEIRKLCIKYGGDATGALYDKIIMQPGEMPVEAQLAKLGMTLSQSEEEYSDVGFIFFPSTQQKGLAVARVHGPAENKLGQGDVIVEIEGRALEAMDARQMRTVGRSAFEKSAVGTPIRLKVRRQGQTALLDVLITPVSAKRTVYAVTETPNPSTELKALRDDWMYEGQNKPGSAGDRLRKKLLSKQRS